MSIRNHVPHKGNLILFILSITLFLASIFYNLESVNTDLVARKAEKRIAERLELLDRYVETALKADAGASLHYEKFPEDMVIYKYVNDSLTSWRNQFSVLNDDISSKVVYQRMTTLADRIISPLAKVTGRPQYLNLGPKWYIVSHATDNRGVKIIAGIEIKNDLVAKNSRKDNGVNPLLNISRRYSISPINDTGGSTVCVKGIPMFKIIFESGQAKIIHANSFLKWIAVILLLVSCLMFLHHHRTTKTWSLVTLVTTSLIVMLYIWGRQMQAQSLFFSPGIYADGPILFSFGAIFLINLMVFNFVFCGYMMQMDVLRRIRQSPNQKTWFQIYGGTILAGILLTLVFINWGFRSIVLNSNISLSLFRWNENTLFSLMVYASYLSLLCTVMMELNCLKPVVKALYGKNFNPNAKGSILLLVTLATIYFSLTVINLGFRKEQDRTMIWGNRLSLNRDLELEISLRNIEDAIARDSVMSSLSMTSNEEHIENRITEYYLHKENQEYTVNVNLVDESDIAGLRSIEKLENTGERISKDSRFFFMDDGRGFVSYSGVFSYQKASGRKTDMVISLESRDSRGDRGYYRMMSRYSGETGIRIPKLYSYAKYINGRLTKYKGNYPYPTTLELDEQVSLSKKNFSWTRKNKFTHFINRTSDNEIVIISRQSGNLMTFFTSISYLFLIEWFILHMFFGKKRIRKVFKKNYYRSRINTILFVTSTFILVGITTVSLIFVLQRNEINLKSIMSSKISMLQSHVETQAKEADDYKDLENLNFLYAIEEIGNITKSDLTLFTPSGKVFLSTTPEIFERMIMGSRINANAFHNIVEEHHRFYVHDEKFEGQYYYSMYAPIFNEEGKMVAILSAPYTEESFNFKVETVLHTALVINLFIILLLLSLFFSSHEVNEMFKPLLEMGKKMSKADLDNLEYIEYNQDDEISTIVEEYNRMVKALQESKVIMAKAERNKAWSEMARQIAHEIKNPLTPIQLELQMLIRKKKNNDPVWIERFDKACDVILEHIKILTDTATLFSNVAKIYEDEPQRMDLDDVVKEHITIYENRDNIKVSYMGMKDSIVMAPRSQIIRVFVNLMTNSVQAIENYQNELKAEGAEVPMGNIIVCLRRSTRDGFYDLVVEDNGPGVKEENLEKLFIPNFTTKSSGTGLGLAICRNIIEECGGEIKYKKSFVLKGASFTVTLPRYDD